MYQECGLEAEHIEITATETLRRLVRREYVPPEEKSERPLIRSIVRDPWVSYGRIVGRGGADLPFVSEEEDKLSPAAFASVFMDAGMDPIVAMAFANVMVEAYGPKDFYSGLWKLLKLEGNYESQKLRAVDWQPLRDLYPDLLQVAPKDQDPTEQVPIAPDKTEVTPALTETKRRPGVRAARPSRPKPR